MTPGPYNSRLRWGHGSVYCRVLGSLRPLEAKSTCPLWESKGSPLSCGPSGCNCSQLLLHSIHPGTNPIPAPDKSHSCANVLFILHSSLLSTRGLVLNTSFDRHVIVHIAQLGRTWWRAAASGLSSALCRAVSSCFTVGWIMLRLAGRAAGGGLMKATLFGSWNVIYTP